MKLHTLLNWHMEPHTCMKLQVQNLTSGTLKQNHPYTLYKYDKILMYTVFATCTSLIIIPAVRLFASEGRNVTGSHQRRPPAEVEQPSWHTAITHSRGFSYCHRFITHVAKVLSSVKLCLSCHGNVSFQLCFETLYKRLARKKEKAKRNST